MTINKRLPIFKRRYVPCGSFLTMGFAALASVSGLSISAQGADPTAPVWSKDVLPILRANCFACHQTSKTQGGYLMTDFARLLKGGESGDPAIVPGNVDASHLVREITPVDGKSEMPKNLAPLKPTEIDIIKRWIAAGAIQDVVDQGPRFTAEKPPVYTRPPAIIGLDFSPDDSQLALTGFHEVLVLGTQDWQLKNRLIGQSPRIESVRFSPDNRWIAVVGGEPGVQGELQLWNNENKQLHRSMLLGGETLFGVSWTGDSSLLALGMADNSIRAFDLEGNQKLYQRAHEDWPRSTVFTVDGKHLISGARDMTVKLTEVETERFIDNVTSITPGALRGGVQALARHPERDEILVGGSDGTPKIYRVFRQTARVIGDDANLIRQLDPMPGRIFSVAISPDGKYLAAASTVDNQSVVKVWSYDVDGKLPPEIKAIQAKRANQRKPEERKKLEVYITEQPQLLGTFNVPNAAVYSIAIDHQGRLASGSSDGHVRVWNIADGSLMADVDATPAGSTAVVQDSSLASMRIERLKGIAEAHRVEHAERNAPQPNASSELAHRPIPLDKIGSIQVEPASIDFAAWNDSAQIVVMAKLTTGELVDATPQATFVAGSDAVWVSQRGWEIGRAHV